MFVTDKFVMIHFPKTGSTFARKALKRIYALVPFYATDDGAYSVALSLLEAHSGCVA